MYTKIGIFDSGIGGVTVLRECIKLNHDFEYLYYSDSVHNPYGDKDSKIVIGYCEDIVNYFIDNGCKIIIIACNTASAMAVSYLRDKYKDIYFIAIEPAVKLVYDMSDLGTLILATKGTLDSVKFHELFDKYHHNNFYLYSCVGLANLIEEGNEDKIIGYLYSNLSSYRGIVSNVVLRCTHYPLVKKEITEVLGDVAFYDGSIGVAKRLSRIIDENGFYGKGYEVIFKDSTGSVEKENRFFEILRSE